MRRVKVLHLITRLIVGGAQDNTLLTVKGLDRERYQVDLASSPTGAWSHLGPQYADRYYPIAAMRQDEGEIMPLWDAQALVQVVRLLRDGQYDIVHTHSSKAGIVGRVAARLVRVPVVVHTIHGFPFHHHMSGTRRRLYVGLERFGGLLAHKLITVCEANKLEAADLGLAPPDKIVTIPSGIDMSRFEIDIDRRSKKRELGLHPDWPVVGTVGRLSQQKAPQDFVRAARYVLAECPQTQFVLVGDGPLQQDVAAMIGAESRIKMLGYRADVPEVLQAFDVFALASWWEGLGRALTEAMISCLPVAVTAVNGVPELVLHGETGLLSPLQDPRSLADNIIYLLRNPETARRYGENAHRRVGVRFSVERMIQGISALYEQLLERKRRFGPNYRSNARSQSR